MNFALSSHEIEQQQLQQLLHAAHATPEMIQCKQNTTSTNDDIQQLFQQGYRSALVVSQQQSQGRGQSQREWISAPIGNIYLSVLLTLDRPVDGRFSLECGLNILHCPILQQLAGLKLKWANDLYSHLGKWGGILVEPIDAKHVIVGVGINVFQPPQAEHIPQPITHLQALGLTNFDRAQLISELYLALLQAAQWFNFDCQNLAQRFNHVAAFKDQWITIQRQQQLDLLGYFRGIQDDGALLIQQPNDILPTVCYDGRIVIPT